MRAGLALACALCLGACGNDLDLRAQDVKDLRVLAVCADTPEIFVASVPLPIEGGEGLSGWPYVIVGDSPPVTVRTLLVDGRGPLPAYRYEVVGCVTNGEATCDREASSTLPLVEETTAAPGDVDGPVFTVAPTVEQLNTWLAVDPYRGYGSLYVTLALRITTATGEVLEATKLLTYTHPGVTPAEGQEPPPPPSANTNPARWSLLGEDDGPSLDASQLDASLTLAPGQVWSTRVTLGGADPPYAVPRFPTARGEVPGYEVNEEQLFLDFYATDGEWAERGVTNRDVFGDVNDLSAEYTAPDAPPEAPLRLYFVSSDDRGGCAWRTARVTLEGAPR